MVEIIIIAIIGIFLSAYALYVEKKMRIDKKYNAVCDISKNISCSRAFRSKYGKLFGVSNSLIGILFYFLVIVFYFINLNFVLYISILAVVGSFYLAYISYVKMKNFCLVCTGIYLVNILLLLFSI